MSKPHEGIALGLVGLGKIAHNQHLPAIAAGSGFRLVATASPGDRLDGIAGYDSLDAMLAAHPEIVALSLCTPPAVRADLAESALREGCHVMLEKPPAASTAQAEHLHQIALEAERTLFATWHSRESVCVDFARIWLAGKTILRASIDWREDIRHWHPGQDWILESAGMGVFDPGINALSILTAIVPGTIELADATLAIPANRSAAISGALALKLPGGAPVSVTLDFLNSGEQIWDIGIETTQGILSLRKGGHELWIDGKLVDSCSDNEYASLYRRFANLIRNRQCEVDLRPLSIVTQALEKARITRTADFEF